MNRGRTPFLQVSFLKFKVLEQAMSEKQYFHSLKNSVQNQMMKPWEDL